MDCLKTAHLIFVWALLCTSCVAQPSSNFVKLVAEAEKETDAKNWQAAITLWEKVNQQNPGPRKLHLSVGKCLPASGKL